MLRSVESFYGYEIQAMDGDLGTVHDVYFDDQSWSVMYLVVDTGTWLPGRKVLIFATQIDQPDWASKNLPVELTKDQVALSSATSEQVYQSLLSFLL